VELGHLMRLDAEPDMAAVASQPFRLSWRASGRGRWIRHTPDYPDYFVRRRNGTAVVLDVRPDATLGRTVRREYDPEVHSVRQREPAKLAELREAGAEVSLSTLQRLRTRFEREGVRGWWTGGWSSPPRARAGPIRGWWPRSSRS
jgi:hypothetical protein